MPSYQPNFRILLRFESSAEGWSLKFCTQSAVRRQFRAVIRIEFAQSKFFDSMSIDEHAFQLQMQQWAFGEREWEAGCTIRKIPRQKRPVCRVPHWSPLFLSFFWPLWNSFLATRESDSHIATESEERMTTMTTKNDHKFYGMYYEWPTQQPILTPPPKKSHFSEHSPIRKRWEIDLPVPIPTAHVTDVACTAPSSSHHRAQDSKHKAKRGVSDLKQLEFRSGM